ncbi:MAG: GAF domain-containing protein [Verrucomicrobiota bacterium]|nr:GAF domain-containing protein [Verrucomicrobiota bacterium]
MEASFPDPLEAALQSGSPSAVLEAAMRQFGCQAGTVHLVRDGMLKLVAHHNIPPHIIQIVDSVPIGKGIAGLAAERREPVSLCNLQEDSSGQARPGAKATGMEGSLAVPMLAGDQLRGVLGIAKASAHDWTDSEKDELLRIAAELARRSENAPPPEADQ